MCIIKGRAEYSKYQSYYDVDFLYLAEKLLGGLAADEMTHTVLQLCVS
jgi:hypothetical protein